MKTIYYCHDTQTNHRPRCNDLEMAGYDVRKVRSGLELARLIARETPDLILLDILLEGEDGFAVCRDLHMAEGETPPVMIFAGIYSRAGFRDEAMRLGARNYLISNITRNAFLNTVAQCMDSEGDKKTAA